MTALVAPLLVGFVVALGGTLACERLAPRLGLVTAPRQDRWHRRPVPLLGGVAIMAGVVAAALPAAAGQERLASVLLVAVAMGLVGLFDDVRTLTPPAKLVAQLVLAGVLIQLGVALRVGGYPVVSVLLTAFWVIGITNAVNLLDNMDGLAAGIAAIAAAARLALAVLDGDLATAALSAGLIGALGGFLVRNFPPARIFMGDAGSLFVGSYLSALCLVGGGAWSRRSSVVVALLLPALLAVIPIFDTTFVTLTRLLTGRPVSRGGRDHTSHRLVALGITERRALGVLYAVAILAAAVAVAAHRFGLTHTVVLVTLLVVGLTLLGVHLSRVQVLPPGETPPAATLARRLIEFSFKRHVATIVLDLVLIVAAYYTAYLLRFEGTFEANRGGFVRTVVPVMIIQLLSLTLFGEYRGLWRYVSVPELLRLFRGITVGVAASALYFLFTTRFQDLSRAVFILDWVLALLLLGAARLSFRLLGELLRPRRDEARRVLIYGAGDGGELTLREFRNNPALRREAIGFLDDDRDKARTRIHSVPVLGGLDALEDILAAHPVEEVVVASAKIPAERLERLEGVCAHRGVRVRRASVRIE